MDVISDIEQQPIYLLMLSWICSSLTAENCFDSGYADRQPVAWKECCAVYWLKDLQESMDRCTGCNDITEAMLKMPLHTNQSIN